MVYLANYDSPIGAYTIVIKDNALIGLYKEGQKYFLSVVKEESKIVNDHPFAIKAKEWLNRYFQGKTPDPQELSLVFIGTPFQKKVWQLLLQIPYGKTTTYGVLAQAMAFRLKKENMSAQAIGSAVGHNPLSIIVPCHRVIAADGSLTGYAGGLETKKKLLRLEGAL